MFFLTAGWDLNPHLRLVRGPGGQLDDTLGTLLRKKVVMSVVRETCPAMCHVCGSSRCVQAEQGVDVRILLWKGSMELGITASQVTETASTPNPSAAFVAAPHPTVYGWEDSGIHDAV
jgi:hypothetical protein